MCGIIAFCRRGPAPEPTNKSSLHDKLNQALQLIQHRGPDGSNTWVHDSGAAGLGHCRLAVNDLSPAAQQPLHHEQLSAVVNGEIYDYDRLRAECEAQGYRFSSGVDSELVLALYRIYGAPGLFDHLRGEFAFVLHDGETGRTIVGRDRYGIKPLFWTAAGEYYLFAAEAKAFAPFGWRAEWDVGAILSCGWMADERTVFKGVKKLMPGNWMEVSTEGEMTIHEYWDMEYPDQTKPDSRTAEELINQTREHLVDAVRLRMKADVPMGLYLSGGIDSSVVAGIMTHLAHEEHVKLGSEATDKVTCFTIQFPNESGHDESEIAERTAEWLGVKCHKKLCDEAQLARDFEETVYHAEHHFADLNAVAKYALSTLPKEHGIKVILTGEGADEHFGGYSFFIPEVLREPDLLCPDSNLTQNTTLREELFQSALSENAMVMAAQGSDFHKSYANNASLENTKTTMPSTLAAVQCSSSVFASWAHAQHGSDPRAALLVGLPPAARDKMLTTWHPAHGAFYLTAKTLLPNMILAGMSDRVEMAHGLEGRPPLLDHRLTAHVNGVAPTHKVKFREDCEGDELDELQGFWWRSAGSVTRGFTEKWLLREAARPFVPAEQHRRRKQPFLAPASWPRDGPMEKMFRGLLTEERVRGLGFVDWEAARRALEGAFGEGRSMASVAAFRMLVSVGGWVVLHERFGMKTATAEDIEMRNGTQK